MSLRALVGKCLGFCLSMTCVWICCSSSLLLPLLCLLHVCSSLLSFLFVFSSAASFPIPSLLSIRVTYSFNRLNPRSLSALMSDKSSAAYVFTLLSVLMNVFPLLNPKHVFFYHQKIALTGFLCTSYWNSNTLLKTSSLVLNSPVCNNLHLHKNECNISYSSCALSMPPEKLYFIPPLTSDPD